MTAAARAGRGLTSVHIARAVPFLFVGLLLAAPLCWIVVISLGYPKLNTNAYQSLFQSEALFRIGAQTFSEAAVATIAALIIGYPVAYTVASLSPKWALVGICFVSFPLWTSLLVRTYAWIAILAPTGPLNHFLQFITRSDTPFDLLYSRFGAVVGLTHSVLPYMILPIYAAIRKIDSGLVRAAQGLGATPFAVFIKVTGPLSLPGVIAGCLFAFLLGMGAFVIPALLGGPRERTIGMAIENTANQLLDWNLAASIAIALLIATVVLLLAVHCAIGLQSIFGGEPSYRRWRRFMRPITRVMELLKFLRRKPRQPATGRPGRILDPSKIIMRPVAAFGFIFLVAPLLVVVPLSFSSSQYLHFPPPGFSFQWYAKYFGNSQWLSSTVTSILIGLAVVALALFMGILTALTARKLGPLARTLLTVGCMAPMIIPNMILALGYFFFFSQLHLVGTWTGLVLAHSMLALPFVFVTVDAALREIDPALERAAAVSGATPITAFVKIVLPLLKPSILTAALFAFIVSFDEIVIALFLTSFSVRTLPKMMWENITMFIDPTISAVSVVLITASIVLMVTAQLVTQTRRSIGKQRI